MSEKELLALKNSIEKALARIEKKRKIEARKAIAAEARKHGFSLSDLLPDAAGKKAVSSSTVSKSKKPVAPKYRDPNDSARTWSGRGRQPQWYKSAIEAGIDPKKLEI